ncbi:hypothetical protein SH2C18_42750 [Clostridium sediminicola]|uniref:PDGLE domain-containing protein n=1 Tax=Clostridium sediminicola TaxID=3114879 RepID=UPI0031F1D114
MVLRVKKNVVSIFVAALLIAAILSPFASAKPDGLERVAEDLMFIELVKNNMFEIMPDYAIKSFDNPYLSTALAGVIGVIITASIVVLFTSLLKKSNGSAND